LGHPLPSIAENPQTVDEDYVLKPGVWIKFDTPVIKRTVTQQVVFVPRRFADNRNGRIRTTGISLDGDDLIQIVSDPTSAITFASFIKTAQSFRREPGTHATLLDCEQAAQLDYVQSGLKAAREEAYGRGATTAGHKTTARPQTRDDEEDTSEENSLSGFPSEGRMDELRVFDDDGGGSLTRSPSKAPLQPGGQGSQASGHGKTGRPKVLKPPVMTKKDVDQYTAYGSRLKCP
jgi:hypothetical protein